MTSPTEEPRGPSKAKEIFLDLLDVPREQRAIELATRTADDPALRAAVQSLLDADERASGFLAGPTVIEPNGPRAALDDVPHRQIGPYKLLQVIGEGGFGTVYMAEQESPVRRRVALKVIKLGMDTRQVVARFEAERQALAIMDHPNIARVFEAGATEQGRPYFVMELVRGDPITKYCDAQRLTPRQRLELFVPVCQAVQHAHQKGIIHRDIKPSNVLVTMHDGKPVPKVIDFGIAKATQSKLTEKTLFTEFRQMVGTPEYMSPEQAEMSGLDIDTRSDIYSLGVLLYELLTGTTPFDARDLRSKAYAEIQRVIREVDPPKPSTRIESMRDTIGSVAAQRGTEPRRLGTIVRGELDWIVMKCLEKDRTRRYESASNLAADVMNFLSDAPVSASPPGGLYRLRKAVRRNRVPVLVGAFTFAVLAAGLLVSLYGLRESRRSEGRARDALAVAEQRRAEAETANQSTAAVNQFLVDMLQSADPLHGAGKDVTVVQTIDAAAREMGERFGSRPLVEAQLRQTIGMTYNNLGRGELARQNLESAYALRRKAVGDDAVETIQSQNDLAMVLSERGEHARAESLYRDALARAQRLRGTDDALPVQIRQNLALLLVSTDRIAEGRRELEDVLRIWRAKLGADHQDVVVTMANVAYAAAQAGQTRDAARLFRDAADAAARAFGPDHPRTLAIRMSLASNLETLGQLDEAERIVRDALERQQRVLPADHPDTLYTLNALVNVLYRQERIDETEPVARELARRMEGVYGPDAAETLVTRGNLAFLLKERGRHDEAANEFRNIIEHARRALGEDNIATMRARGNLATTLREQKRLDEAEAIFRAEIPRWRRVRGPNHPETLVQLRGLGETLEAATRLAEAEPVYAELYAAAEQSQDDPKQVARNMTPLGLTRAKLGKHADAEAPLRAALLRMIDAGDAKDLRVRELYETLIDVCEKTGRPDEANRLRAEFRALRQPATTSTAPATTHPSTRP